MLSKKPAPPSGCNVRRHLWRHFLDQPARRNVSLRSAGAIRIDGGPALLE